MSPTDDRKPALVTQEFRERVADSLAPHGFAPRAQCHTLVRKKGKNVHRIEFQSSHRNAPGYAVVWPALVFEDAATRKLVKGWRAGGPLNGPAFSLDTPVNVADAEDADHLAALIQERLAFFDWLEDPERVLADVARRYVSGLVDPLLVAPYLRAHLGEGGVLTYAAGLIGGRAELAPAFATELRSPSPEDGGSGSLDHGTQLARAARDLRSRLVSLVPTDVVESTARAARHLRNHLGLQLRAWGEPDAARALRRAHDDDVTYAYAAQKALSEPGVDSVAGARLALTLATGATRDPVRSAPEPRLFQYFVRHTEPFAPVAAAPPA